MQSIDLQSARDDLYCHIAGQVDGTSWLGMWEFTEEEPQQTHSHLHLDGRREDPASIRSPKVRERIGANLNRSRLYALMNYFYNKIRRRNC